MQWLAVFYLYIHINYYYYYYSPHSNDRMENAARKEAQKVPKGSVKSELYQDYLTMPIHKDALMKFLLTAALRELIMTFFVHFPERINM